MMVSPGGDVRDMLQERVVPPLKRAWRCGGKADSPLHHRHLRFATTPAGAYHGSPFGLGRPVAMRPGRQVRFVSATPVFPSPLAGKKSLDM